MIWAGIERFVPRIATAGLMLLLGALTNPATVGLYAWAMIVLTLVQSAVDSPLRQFGVIILRARDGVAKLRRAMFFAMGAGAFGVAIGIGAVLVAVPQRPPGALALVFLAAHPVLTGAQLPSLARYQNAERWRTLARFQSVGVVAGLLISVPTLLVTRSLFAPVAQLLVVEAVVLIGLRRDRARAQVVATHSQPLRRPLLQTSMASIAAWSEGQLDRVAVGIVGGAAMLGLYTTAFSAARSPGEAAATGAANALRPQVDVSQSDAEIAVRLGHSARRAIALAGSIVIATWVASQTLLPLLLPAAWDVAIATVPIIAITVVPITLSWQLTACCAVRDKMRTVLRVRVFGAALAISAGALALISLEAVAWGLLGREIFVLGLLVWVCKGFMRRETLVLTSAVTAICVMLELVLSSFNLL